MPNPELFIPDQALHFRRLPEQYQIIQAMRRAFDEFRTRGYSSYDALYYAYVLQSPNQHGVATAVGVNEFHRRMTEYLRQAQNMVEHVIERYLGPFAGRLDPHNAVSNCLDPIAMLKMATDDLSPGSSSLQHRRHLEAMRQLAIALQLFAIETVDHESWVADDLATIDQLSWKRLFLPDESEQIWVLIQQYTDQELAGSAKFVEIFTRAWDKTSRIRRLRREHVVFKEELLSCRIAVIGNKRFYIYAVNRRKRLLSTLLKLERGRPSTDRRGWKYVVVATRAEPDMPLTLATPEDVTIFSAHSRQAMWETPLFPKEDDSPPNPDSSNRYTDEKILGRFHRPDNGRIIAGSAEQLTTTIARHVDTLYARDGVNHNLYRARQVLRYLAPLWFPHRLDVFGEVSGIKLPGYGVAWNKRYFCDQLERWWQTRLT